MARQVDVPLSAQRPCPLRGTRIPRGTRRAMVKVTTTGLVLARHSEPAPVVLRRNALFLLEGEVEDEAQDLARVAVAAMPTEAVLGLARILHPPPTLRTDTPPTSHAAL